MECAPYIKVWRDLQREPCLRRQTRKDGGACGWTFLSILMLANDCDFIGNPHRGLLVKDGDFLTVDDISDASGQKEEVSKAGLCLLLGWGWVVLRDDGSYFIPKYERRQESREAKRQREFRDRQRDKNVTEDVIRNVTSNAESNGHVTPCPGPGPGPGLGPDLGPGPGPGKWPQKEQEHLSPPGAKVDEPKPEKEKKPRAKDTPAYHISVGPNPTTGEFEILGVTESDRAYWRYKFNFDNKTIDDRLQALLDHCASKPTWYKERNSGQWTATIRNWFARSTAKAGSQPALDFRAVERAAEREWQLVMQSGASNDYQKIGFAVAMLHPRTIAALKVIDKDPANAVWRMADIPLREQLIYKAAFLPAWKASGIPYEVAE